MPRLLVRCLALLLLACLSLTACHRDPVAPGDPVAAVTGMAQAIRDDDLVRYSRLSVPPDLHKRMQKRWTENLKAAPAPTAAEQRDYARWMLRLTGADAEKNLYRDFDAKLRKVESELGSQWPLMQATGGIFINGLIKANDKLGSAEKAHAQAVGAALLQWLTPATLTDRAKARAAIAILAETARGLDLPTLQHSRRLEMIPALEKGGQILKGLKRVAGVYGVDANAALAGVKARLLSANGDLATMEVSYPMFGKTITFEMQLIRRDGRWYNADAVREAELNLARPVSVGREPARP